MNCRGCHAHFAEGVFVEDFELGAGLDDKRVAVFAEAEDSAVIGHRRCCEFPGAGIDLSPAVNLATRLGIIAAQHAPVIEDVQVIAVYDRRWIIRAALLMAPGDEFTAASAFFECDVAFRSGPDREDWAFLVTHVAGSDIEQTMPGKGSRNYDD